MKGRKPTPTALKKLRGNPGKRPISDDEPQPDSEGAEAVPEWLDAVEAEAWSELATTMHACGMLTHTDRHALATYCQLWARYRKLWADSKADGPVVYIGGEIKANPIHTEALKVQSLLVKVRAELGLNATARTRIRAESAEKKNTHKPADFLKFDPSAA